MSSRQRTSYNIENGINTFLPHAKEFNPTRLPHWQILLHQPAMMVCQRWSKYQEVPVTTSVMKNVLRKKKVFNAPQYIKKKKNTQSINYLKMTNTYGAPSTFMWQYFHNTGYRILSSKNTFPSLLCICSIHEFQCMKVGGFDWKHGSKQWSVYTAYTTSHLQTAAVSCYQS